MIRHLLSLTLPLVCAAPASATTIVATCATLPMALDKAQGGETIVLKGDCPTLTVKKAYPDGRPITIDAHKATVRGLVISGKNVNWVGGTISAPGGMDGSSTTAYAANVRGAANITFHDVTFTNFRKGVVPYQSQNVAVTDSHFTAYREDAIIASQMKGLTVLRNLFDKMDPVPTTCTLPNAVAERGLSKSACVKKGGAWRDGNHADAVQMWNDVTDVLIAENVVAGNTQGLTQMGAGAPLQRVRIERNRVTGAIHQITLGNCIDCVIKGNTVRRWMPQNHRAVIRVGMAKRCENDAQDEKSDGGC